MWFFLIYILLFFTNFENIKQPFESHNVIGYQSKQPIIYPSKNYQTNVVYRQTKLEENNHLQNGYDYRADFELKDFKKYSFDYYDYQIKFKFIEQVWFINNQLETYTTDVKFMIKKSSLLVFELPEQILFDVIKQERVTIKPTISLIFNEDFTLTFFFEHKLSYSPQYKNRRIFSRRQIQINAMNVQIKPKIDYLKLNDTVVDLIYNPLELVKELENINQQISRQLSLKLDQLDIDRIVFNYFFDLEILTEQEIEMLSIVEPDLTKKIAKQISFTQRIESDKFLNQMTKPSFSIKAQQRFSVDQLGIPSKIEISVELEAIDEVFLYQLIFNNDLNFVNLVSFEKCTANNWVAFGKNQGISGAKTIELVKISSSPSTEQDQETNNDLPKVDQDVIEGDGEQVVVLKVKQYNPYYSIIMFCISLLLLLLIPFAYLIKKILSWLKKQ